MKTPETFEKDCKVAFEKRSEDLFRKYHEAVEQAMRRHDLSVEIKIHGSTNEAKDVVHAAMVKIQKELSDLGWYNMYVLWGSRLIITWGIEITLRDRFLSYFDKKIKYPTKPKNCSEKCS